MQSHEMHVAIITHVVIHVTMIIIMQVNVWRGVCLLITIHSGNIAGAHAMTKVIATVLVHNYFSAGS